MLMHRCLKHTASYIVDCIQHLRCMARRRGGKIILMREGWASLAQLRQQKTGLGGKELLKSHLGWPNDLVMIWDSLD